MKTRYFTQLPQPYWTYPKIALGVLKNKQITNPSLPKIDYVVEPFYIQPSHLQRYNQICDFKNTGYIPAIYFLMLSQRLQMYMMTQEDFIFPVLGLVHLSNQVTQYQYLPANLQYRLSCCFGEIRTRPNGYEIEFITKVDLDKKTVVRGVSTYFYRQKTNMGEFSEPLERIDQLKLRKTWNLEESIGRRYALISGDFNFIHLHALSAKIFGFKQAIAHGMWSKAKVLAELNLPEKYDAYVEFKAPMLLPSSVQLNLVEDENIIHLSVVGNKTHMLGRIRI